MLVKLKSNGKEVEIKKSDFEKFSEDQRRNYNIIDSKDAVESKKQVAENIAKEEVKPIKIKTEPEKK